MHRGDCQFLGMHTMDLSDDLAIVQGDRGYCKVGAKTPSTRLGRYATMIHHSDQFHGHIVTRTQQSIAGSCATTARFPHLPWICCKVASKLLDRQAAQTDPHTLQGSHLLLRITRFIHWTIGQ